MADNRIEKSLIKKGDIEKINAFSARELSEDEVFVFNLTLCDNDIDRDFEKFSLSALTELAPLFVGKTVIADHSMKSSDQRARIFDTYIEKIGGKVTADGDNYYCLKARAYMLKSEENKALIDEIEAGIKKEGSVSCAMGKHICSICSKDRRREGCNHINSKMYDGKLCYTILEEPEDAYEFSFVAVPAQRNAGVTKLFNTREDKMENIVKMVKDCGDEGLSLNKAQADKLTGYLESLEDEAQLAKHYREELEGEVSALFAKRFPEVDAKLFASLTAVMTAKELAGFKSCINKKEAKPAAPQLMPLNSEKTQRDFSQFKI